MGKRLYVGNLSYNTTELDLRDLFAKFGTVADAKLVTDRDTGRPRGFGFVEMSTDAEATAAIGSLNGQELQGRALTVNEAKSAAVVVVVAAAVAVAVVVVAVAVAAVAGSQLIDRKRPRPRNGAGAFAFLIRE